MNKQDINTQKTCKDCQILKPLKDFYPSVLTKDGRNKRCKECQDAINAAKAKQYKKKADERRKLKANKIAPQSEKGKLKAQAIKEVKEQITTEAISKNKYYCAGCLATNQNLDRSHILSIAQRPDLAAEKENLNLLCRSCHEKWESGQINKMTKLACFIPDMRYIYQHDQKRFNQILFKLLDENEARPSKHLESIILKIEKFG